MFRPTEILAALLVTIPYPNQLSGALLRDALRVAVLAGDGVDVVLALGGQERRVHLLHLAAAMGVGGMARGA